MDGKGLKKHLDYTDAELEAFFLKLRKFLDKNIKKIVRSIKSGELEGLDAASVLGALSERLKQNGLDKEVSKLQALFSKELEFVEDIYLSAVGVKDALGALGKQEIKALIAPKMDKARLAVQAHIGDVRTILTDAVFGIGTNKIDSILEKKALSFDSAAKTELTTVLQGFSREVTWRVADELGFKAMRYFGPKDVVTRPFCRDLLTGRTPPIYTIKEIEKMDNGQGLSVMQYCGGWNCRHQWSPVEKE